MALHLDDVRPALLSRANVLGSPGATAAGLALVFSGLANLEEWPADRWGWVKLLAQAVGGGLAVLMR